MTEDRIRNRNRAAQGQAAIGGASTEAAAAQAAENGKVSADITSAIAANAAAQKNAIEGQYRANKAALNDQLNDSRKQQADYITQAISGVADEGSKIASLI